MAQVNVSDLVKAVIDVIYPVGSVYITFDNREPNEILGGAGKWEKVQNTTLVGAGGEYAVGSTGGNKTVKLSSSNIPSLSGTTNSAGAHTHATRLRVAGWNGWSATHPKNLSSIKWNGENINNADKTSTTPYGSYDDLGVTSSSGAHTHTVSYTNNNQSEVNVQDPYTAVYIWKRVE